MILQVIHAKENLFEKEFVEEENENVLNIQLAGKECAFLCHIFIHDVEFTRMFQESNPLCLLKINLTDLASSLDYKS